MSPSSLTTFVHSAERGEIDSKGMDPPNTSVAGSVAVRDDVHNGGIRDGGTLSGGGNFSSLVSRSPEPYGLTRRFHHHTKLPVHPLECPTSFRCK